MIDNTGNCFETDISFSDFGMVVFVVTHWVKAVIKVNSAQSVKPDDSVEFVYHLIKLMNDIVSAVEDMTCIETYPQEMLQFNTVDNLR